MRLILCILKIFYNASSRFCHRAANIKILQSWGPFIPDNAATLRNHRHVRYLEDLNERRTIQEY